MRDNIVNKGTVSAAAGETVGDTAKAWTLLIICSKSSLQKQNFKPSSNRILPFGS